MKNLYIILTLFCGLAVKGQDVEGINANLDSAKYYFDRYEDSLALGFKPNLKNTLYIFYRFGSFSQNERLYNRLNKSIQNYDDSLSLFYFKSMFYYQNFMIPEGDINFSIFSNLSHSEHHFKKYLDLIKYKLLTCRIYSDTIFKQKSISLANFNFNQIARKDKIDTLNLLLIKATYYLIDIESTKFSYEILDTIITSIQSDDNKYKLLLAEANSLKFRACHDLGLRLEGKITSDISSSIYNLYLSKTHPINLYEIDKKIMTGVYLNTDHGEELKIFCDYHYEALQSIELTPRAILNFNALTVAYMDSFKDPKKALQCNTICLDGIESKFSYLLKTKSMILSNRSEIFLQLKDYDNAIITAQQMIKHRKIIDGEKSYSYARAFDILARIQHLSDINSKTSKESILSYTDLIIPQRINLFKPLSENDFEINVNILAQGEDASIPSILLDTLRVQQDSYLKKVLDYDIGINNYSSAIKQLLNQFFKQHVNEKIELKKCNEKISDSITKLNFLTNDSELLLNRSRLQKKIQSIIFNENEITNRNLLNYDKLINSLKNEELLVKFYVYTPMDAFSIGKINRYGVFLISPKLGNPIYIPIGREKELLHEIKSANKEFYTSYYKFGPLLDNLLEQIKPILKNHRKIYIQSTGIFENINVISIFQNLSLKSSFKSVSNYEINRDEDATDLQNLLCIGGLNYEGNTQNAMPIANLLRGKNNNIKNGNWVNLKHSLDEINSINDIAESKVKNIKLVKENEGTKQNILQLISEKPSIIHFAGHSFSLVDTIVRFKNMHYELNHLTYSFLTGLVTIPDSLNPGILSAYDLGEIDLTNTKLVVLSSCESNFSFLFNNRRMLNLAQIFKQAGAQKVLASLWQVPDESTKDLMIEFYKNWLNKKQAPHIALANAQKKIRKKYVDPIHWAGWVLLE